MENNSITSYRDRFWENLDRIRKERGLSWNALSYRLGIPSSALFHAKSVKSIPRAENMQLYANALDVPVSELFDI